MEDYAGACAARYQDVEALLGCQPRRSTAAVHFGGIAVECHVKALVLRYHEISEWNQLGRRSGENYYRKPVERPGHHLPSSIKMMARLYEKARADRLFLEHLDQLQHPVGSRDADFIDLRYSGSDVAAGTMDAWQASLKYVSGWLKKNGVI
jgi:hypothetical protein